MHTLGSDDIGMLLFQVNSDVSLATAAGMPQNTKPSGAPRDWASGRTTPTPPEMARLVALRDVLNILTSTSGLKNARHWLDTHMISLHSGEEVTVFEAIGRGYFEAVRAAAREHMHRRRR